METELKVYINETNNRVVRISSLDESVNFENEDFQFSIYNNDMSEILFAGSTISILKSQVSKTVLEMLRVPDHISLSEVRVCAMGSSNKIDQLFAVITFSHTNDLMFN